MTQGDLDYAVELLVDLTGNTQSNSRNDTI